MEYFKSEVKGKKDLKVFALGGLLEVGKNMYCVEYDNEIIVIDSGILFPEDTLYGIDYIIPDYSYLKENESKIKGLFITHGHEDHIGGIPYLLQTVRIPVIYAHGITVELIKKKLEDFPKLRTKIYNFDPFEKINFTNLNVSFLRLNHSIPDSFGFVIGTPYGKIVTTGDFKFDFTPVGQDADYQEICNLGKDGILLLMSDSTNAKVKELSNSEKLVSENIKDLFREVKGRVIISTFASNVTRISQIIESSIASNRKVLIIGKSMESMVQIGIEKGYIKATDADFISDKEIRKYSSEQVTILCTGSQGEPMAALTRIAQGNHKQIHVEKGDTIIFSSSVIPGNSLGIDYLINLLSKQEANVIVNSTFNDVHASGHASSQEQKLMIKLLRPKYFMPMHGQYYMLKTHARSAIDAGLDPANVFVLENGKVLCINEKGAKVLSNKVPAKDILIDGTDIGGVNTAIINERMILSQKGMLTVVVTLKGDYTINSKPTIISKGFLFAKESEEIFASIEQFIKNRVETCPHDLDEIKRILTEETSTHIESLGLVSPLIFIIVNMAKF